MTRMLDPPRKRLRFKLRTLLLAVAVLSAMLAIAVRVGPVWSLAIGWTLLLVAAHVVGNAFGTKAVENSPSRDELGDSSEGSTSSGPVEFAPATRLHRSTRLGWLTFLLTAVGAIIGGVIGTVGLIAAYAEQGAYVGIALGIVCAAALGGFFGFLGATSLGMTLRAWNEAAKHARR